MIVRGITATGDWLFGKGLNDYKSGQNAVAQNIETRLKCFLGDCFFDEGAGIDWFNFLGSKDQTGLNLAISSTILNTQYVTKMTQLYVNLTAARELIVSYNVDTSFGTLAGRATVTSPVL